MKREILIIVFASAALFSNAQQADNGNGNKRPKLFVGLVVDQMRHDYLQKFQSKYSEDGFKRLIREGYVFTNANFNFVPTYTAPGHACIYTGTTPANNGIISNEWYDRETRKAMYCVGDSLERPVGTTSISGKMSPRNMYSSTVTDALRLSSNMKSKVVGIALKDRGSILAAGHSANASYWHDPHTNNWVTSTYYMKELPSWVEDFNRRKMADSLLNFPWTTFFPIEEYTASTPDDSPYEGLFEGETKPVFPHNLPAFKDKESELIRATPHGNTFTMEFAKAACRGEKLGRGNEVDFLAISFSSTDYVGHMYGINAIELEDVYVRLDRDIAAFLKFLDEWTGKDYMLFLTSDHGAVNNPSYLRDNHFQGGKFSRAQLTDTLRSSLKKYYGTDSLLLSSGANNIFLNRNFIVANKLNLQEIQEECVRIVTGFPGVSTAMTATELGKGLVRTGIYSFMQNGYNIQRSGDVIIQLQPGWLDWFSQTGTSHGSAYSYDTHVPVIFFGNKISPGSTSDYITICDIAPTVSSLLKIEFPNANTGRSLTGYFK